MEDASTQSVIDLAESKAIDCIAIDSLPALVRTTNLKQDEKTWMR
jgi:hypothetical protein